MKAYWDSSAIIEAINDDKIRLQLEKEKPYTRTHSLAEAFSALTGGNLGIRMSADDAADTLAVLADGLEFVDLASTDVLKAFKTARKKGVRGGAVHDYLHAVAAEKHKAIAIVTLDRNDFADLTELEIRQLA